MAGSMVSKRLLGIVLSLAVGTAHASLALLGGTVDFFSGYDAPPVSTSAQSSGLLDAQIVSNDPLDTISVKYLGSDTGHSTNQFYINGQLVFGSEAAPLSSFGTFSAGSPLDFVFKDASLGEEVPNGGSLSTFASYVILGTFDSNGAFSPYTKGGEFSYVLGFNDAQTFDADFDDLVVGIRLGAALPEPNRVPEPGSMSLALSALAATALMQRRRGSTTLALNEAKEPIVMFQPCEHDGGLVPV